MVTHWTYNVVLSYVQSHEDAEEIIQDTILAAINGISGFKSNANIKTWVYRIAINKSKDVLKFRSRKKRIGKVISLSKNDAEVRAFEPKNFIHPGVELESKEQMDMLFGAINKLPAKQKEALIMAKLERMPVKEIASLMDTSPKAVESLLSRAKTNLKSYLREIGIQMTR